MSEEYQRVPQDSAKNRFLFIFFHANNVGNQWGCDWSYKCGVIFFGVFVLLTVVMDIFYVFDKGVFSSGSLTIKVMFFLRFLACVFALIGTVVGIIAVNQRDYKKCTVAYYSAFLSLILNLIVLFLLPYAFLSDYQKAKTYISYDWIAWIISQIFIFLLSWMLFCSMVFINRKNRQLREETNYL